MSMTSQSWPRISACAKLDNYFQRLIRVKGLMAAATGGSAEPVEHRAKNIIPIFPPGFRLGF
jgi:hypothetical protein